MRNTGSTANKHEILNQINDEFKEFVKFSETLNLSNEEFSKMLSPLTTGIASGRFFRRMRYTVFFCLFGILLYSLSCSQTFNDHVTAISRIMLIQLLPFWDWRKLEDQQCLIKLKSEDVEALEEPQFNCAFCEAIKKVNVLHEGEVTAKALLEHYIDVHRPVIINEGITHWPFYKTPNLTLLLNYPKIANSYPCNTQSSIQNFPTDIETTIRKINEFEEGFIHFRNCEVDAIKTFRVVTPRPPFLPTQLSPVRGSWLLVGKNYEFSYLKQLVLDEPNAVVGVVKGTFVFELAPRLNCKEECPIVNIEVRSGEALIITSLWDLYYAPNPTGENIAVILEIR